MANATISFAGPGKAQETVQTPPSPCSCVPPRQGGNQTMAGSIAEPGDVGGCGV